MSSPRTVIISSFLLVFLIAGLVFWQNTKRQTPAPRKIYRIAILLRDTGYGQAIEGYKNKMSELGYVENKNVTYSVYVVSDQKELLQVARSLVEKGVDLIHTYSTLATQAAYEATKELNRPIPVVFGSMGDPLLSGVIKSVQHPGTNVTGVASLSTELTANRLELLKKINPQIVRVAMPYSAPEVKDPAADKSVQVAEKTATYLGITLSLYPIVSSKDNALVAKSITHENADGMIVGGDSLVWGGIAYYIKQAIAEKIPFAVFDVSQVEKGALIGFGPDYRASGKQSALITHQILRGKNPGDISIAAPRLLLAVNLKTASEIGISLGPAFLNTVDVIIGGK